MATPFFAVILGPYTTNESHVRRCLPLQIARQPWWALVKYGNMHFTCTKGSKFLDHLSDYQLVKKASVRFGTVKKARVCSDTTVGNPERQKTLAKTAVTHIGVTDTPHSTLRQLPSAILRSVCCTHSNRGDDVIILCAERDSNRRHWHNFHWNYRHGVTTTKNKTSSGDYPTG